MQLVPLCLKCIERHAVSTSVFEVSVVPMETDVKLTTSCITAISRIYTGKSKIII